MLTYDSARISKTTKNNQHKHLAQYWDNENIFKNSITITTAAILIIIKMP